MTTATEVTYRIFVVKDPTPWMDQFIETAGIMVKKCGGTSVEFVIDQLIKGCRHPNHLILAAIENGKPDKLVAWMFSTYIYDTYRPWVEVWALWCSPGSAIPLRDMASRHLFEWSRAKGAHRVVGILTRSPRVFLKMLHEAVGFKQVGIVIEREL